MINKPKQTILHTWKEIAEYLRSGINEKYLSVRTVRRWAESRGLPVDKTGKTKQARVHINTDQIDEWIEKNYFNNGREKKNKSRSKISYYLMAGSILIILILIYILYFNRSDVSDFMIDGSDIILLDKNGRTTGTFTTGYHDLESTDYYRKFFNEKNLEQYHYTLPQLLIRDIDNDDQPEVLISIQTRSKKTDGVLYCVDRLGNVNWKYKSGRELKFGNTDYSNDYRIIGIDLLDVNRDGKKEIALISYQKYFFPTQFSLLDNNGNLIGEYWNSGRISDVVSVDLNGDNRDEIILAAMNNEYKKGCMIIFNSNRISGSSPQMEASYRCKSLTNGSEEYYILFPRTEINRSEKIMGNCERIDILSNKRISALIKHTLIFYEFDFNLNPLDVLSSHTFEKKYQYYLFKGLVSKKLDENYFLDMKNRILFFNGKEFITSNSRSNHY